MTQAAPAFGLRFDNRFVNELPGEAVDDNAPGRNQGNHPRQVHGACWSPAVPTAVAAPRLIAHSREVAELLGLSEADMQSAELTEVLGGNRLLDGMAPYAACYGGHQFGHWAGQLGDGRAITLGETINTRGERWELQLKGAGRTPYSQPAESPLAALARVF